MTTIPKKYTAKECEFCGGHGTVERINGYYIRVLRENAGISLRQAAIQLGVSAAYLSDMELGKARIKELVATFFEDLTTNQKEI